MTFNDLFNFLMIKMSLKLIFCSLICFVNNTFNKSSAPQYTLISKLAFALSAQGDYLRPTTLGKKCGHPDCRLILAKDWISGASPSVHTTTQGFGIFVPHLQIFCCLTDSGGFGVSGTVENDFLIPRH